MGIFNNKKVIAFQNYKKTISSVCCLCFNLWFMNYQLTYNGQKYLSLQSSVAFQIRKLAGNTDI